MSFRCYLLGALRPRPRAGRRLSPSSKSSFCPFFVTAMATFAATFTRPATRDGSSGEDGFASASCATLPADESARQQGKPRGRVKPWHPVCGEICVGRRTDEREHGRFLEQFVRKFVRRQAQSRSDLLNLLLLKRLPTPGHDYDMVRRSPVRMGAGRFGLTVSASSWAQCWPPSQPVG